MSFCDSFVSIAIVLSGFRRARITPGKSVSYFCIIIIISVPVPVRSFTLDHPFPESLFRFGPASPWDSAKGSAINKRYSIQLFEILIAVPEARKEVMSINVLLARLLCDYIFFSTISKPDYVSKRNLSTKPINVSEMCTVLETFKALKRK